MAVYSVNIVIDQGVDFTQSFTLESSASNAPTNLTGYTGAAQLRKHSASSKFYSFTVQFPDRVGGKVVITMTNEITRRIKPGRYIYDIVLTDSSGTKDRVVEGSVLVRESATK
jgi:hypothetical protein